mgnify:FL=1
MPYHWIDKLNVSNSRKHKEDIIGQAYSACKIGDENACVFLECAVLAYDPFVSFNIKQVPVTENITSKENSWTSYVIHLRDLSNRLVTGYAAISKLEYLSQQYDSTLWNKLFRAVILKDLRVGATAKTFNKILKGTKYEIPTFECQLAQDSKKHKKKLTGPKILQKKLDGVRTLAIIRDDLSNGCSVELFSRNGKPLNNFRIIEEQMLNICYSIKTTEFCNADGKLKYAVVFDGEIMSDNFQKLMKQAQRKTDVDTADCVYNIFDIIPLHDFEKGSCQTVQIERIKQLTKINTALIDSPAINIIDENQSIEVDLDLNEGHDIMRRYMDGTVEQGYEGIMIKNKHDTYQCKRNASWLKLKPVLENDFTIIDVAEGTGKNTGKLGALVCNADIDGNAVVVNVGIGFTDTQRNDYWHNKNELIGHIAEIEYDSITQNQNGGYSLRFPRFVRFRSIEPGEKL